MIKFNVVENVGPPLVVTAVDMLTLELAPDYNEWACYGMTAVGYAAGFLDLGGRTVADFLVRVGAASLPLTARAIRERVKGPVPIPQRVGTSRLALRSSAIRSYPAQPQNAQRWPSAV